MLADPARAARLQVEAADLTVDRLLGAGAAARRGALQPTKVDALMGILAGAPRLTLDGVAVVISEEEVRPVATLTDAPGGGAPAVRLAITADPRVRQVVAGGIALCDDDDGRATLHRLVETEMTGLRLQNLPIRRSFSGAEMGELVTVVLPDLARRAVVDIQSNRLPPVARDLAPRVVLDLDQIEGGLSVLPTLVYGAPPVARIDAGKLVYLRGPVPLRDVPAEQRVVERLRTELDLVVGRRTSFDPRDAPRFVEKLKRWRGDLAGRAAGVVKPASTLVPRLRVTGNDTRRRVRADVRGAGRAGQRFGRQGCRRGVGRARVAGGARAGAAGRGRMGGAAGRVDAEARAARRGSARGARGRRAAGATRAARARGAVRRAGAPAAARARSPGAARGRVRTPPRGAAAVRSHRHAPRLPASRRQLARLPARRRPGRHPRRRHGPRQDAAGDVRVRSCARARRSAPGPPAAPTLVVCPTSVLFNWQSELARFRPSLRVAVYHGPGRSSTRPPT